MVREIGVPSKDQKMVLDVSLFNTPNYKIRIKDEWSNLRKGVAIEKGAFETSSTMVSQRIYLYMYVSEGTHTHTHTHTHTNTHIYI